MSIDKLKEIWYSRNPAHEINADTEKDMFWETVLCVFNDYQKALDLPIITKLNEIIKDFEKDRQDVISHKDIDEVGLRYYYKAKAETLQEVIDKIHSLKELLLLDSGSCSKYDIEFVVHCKAGIEIKDNELKVLGALDGYGDGIKLDEIKINKL